MFLYLTTTSVFFFLNSGFPQKHKAKHELSVVSLMALGKNLDLKILQAPLSYEEGKLL